MASSKDDLIQNIVEMQQEMMQTFQDFLVNAQPLPSLNAEVWRPPTDVLESDDSIIVTMEIPGVGPEDMHIAVEEQRLVVQGRRTRPTPKQKMQFQQMEVNYGQFQRTIALSSPVDEDNVQANYSGGFLQIHLPKITVKKVTKVIIKKFR
ncbi:MAG: Hsp20/alpha crystallin family protein [Planctomycetota bacterium]|nr:Hsp20/alpha crystallin family protein [Planctomycetota bacterium]MDA1143082.1 Hsp20/alpha crystallin family protein [Planctomycetota bacterium]